MLTLHSSLPPASSSHAVSNPAFDKPFKSLASISFETAYDWAKEMWGHIKTQYGAGGARDRAQVTSKQRDED